uniref:Uncharacterized protein LOC111136422 isoform X2 n=1 Tax=Crassostrea virginica TaxID=6565 RepID=A0A8B8ESP0_CRAVI|nr:uncharacterized protein LOC111136422 isoform X2 [Crassostrea virginica]
MTYYPPPLPKHYIKVCSCYKWRTVTDGLFSCLQSAPTIAFVDLCPRNKTEWDRAAERKNCHSMAARQNCTDKPSKFQYHCLLNHHQNATLEVCAPIFYLQGYCPIYNAEKKEILENYALGYECLKFSGTEQCPSRYPSSEAYNYLQCYKTRSKKSSSSNATHCTSDAGLRRWRTQIKTKRRGGRTNTGTQEKNDEETKLIITTEKVPDENGLGAKKKLNYGKSNPAPLPPNRDNTNS